MTTFFKLVAVHVLQPKGVVVAELFYDHDIIGSSPGGRRQAFGGVCLGLVPY